MVGFIFSVWGSIIFGVLYGILSFIIAINMIKSGPFSLYCVYSVLSSTDDRCKDGIWERDSKITTIDRVAVFIVLILYMGLWPVLILLTLLKYLFTDFLFKCLSKATNMVPNVIVKVEKEKSGEKKPEPMHCTDAVPLSEEEIRGNMYADNGV